jgi:hypothetical protein
MVTQEPHRSQLMRFLRVSIPSSLWLVTDCLPLVHQILQFLLDLNAGSNGLSEIIHRETHDGKRMV